MKSNQKVSVSDKIKIWSSRNQIIKAAASTVPAAGSEEETAAGEPADSSPAVQLRARDPPANRHNHNNNNNNSPLNQCINELTSNLHSRRCVSELVAASSSGTSNTTNTSINAGPSDPAQQSTVAPHQQSTTNHNGGAPTAPAGPEPPGEGGDVPAPDPGRPSRTRSASQGEATGPLLASPSHFVTVIEVKESQSSNGGGSSSSHGPPGSQDGPSEGGGGGGGEASTPAAPPPTKPVNYENVLINTGARFGGSVENLVAAGDGGASTFHDNKHPKPSERMSDGGGGSFTGGSSISERTSLLLGASSAAADLKKKVPPR
uniref:Uncharacterized protein n=1 Tax=Anopheles dirus TaxID=7168 RepID=A0A182N0C8_9DIPT